MKRYLKKAEPTETELLRRELASLREALTKEDAPRRSSASRLAEGQRHDEHNDPMTPKTTAPHQHPTNLTAAIAAHRSYVASLGGGDDE